eukprot:2852141-Pleurochrysis_carterae.AAC.2
MASLSSRICQSSREARSRLYRLTSSTAKASSTVKARKPRGGAHAAVLWGVCGMGQGCEMGFIGIAAALSCMQS